MPSETEAWREALGATIMALRETLEPLVKDGRLQAQLDKFLVKIPKYWEAERAGDKQARIILASIKRQTALIVARYARKDSEETKAAIMAAVVSVIKFGFTFLVAMI